MILAIDTSSRYIGLALYDGARVIHETVWISQNYHTMQLAPAVEAALKQAGFQYGDLKCVAIAQGPGSFTGLRIGMALAKGLALALHLPIIGIPSLDVLANAQPVKAPVMAAVLQAGRGRLAVGWYRAEKERWITNGPGEVLTAEALSDKISTPTWVCGELSEDERKILRRNRRHALLATPSWSVRRPAFLAELAWKRWQAEDFDEPASLSPIYLHYGDPIAS
jgi:tRNA threonylcarbamoyladenosine biosynthesis protein TsaB